MTLKRSDLTIHAGRAAGDAWGSNVGGMGFDDKQELAESESGLDSTTP